VRVWLRGLGVLSALGDTPEAFASGLFSGRVALARSAARADLFAGEIAEFKPRSYIAQKGLQVLSRSALLTAAALAILRRSCAPLLEPEGAAEPGGAGAGAREDGGGKLPCERIGLVVGTGFGHIESKARYSEEAAREGPALVSPILFPNTIINSLGGHAAILNGFRGPNSTVTAGCRSSLEALRYAADLLETGRADRVAVAGCDEVSRPLLDGLTALGLLAREDPLGPNSSVPFSQGRSGLYPAEAAAALLLERVSEEGAGPSGLLSPPVLGVIEGSGSSSSVRRGVQSAAREAMEAALSMAGLRPSEIGWLALSGSGSVPLDAAEAEAARALFGGAAPAAAIKRQSGETFGAGGLLAVAAAVLSLERGEVPPTPGLRGALLEGLSTEPRPFDPLKSVLVSVVDEDGASALVVGRA
jgi:3-oxoacyl-(acyl-carrier-protein) synthase